MILRASHSTDKGPRTNNQDSAKTDPEMGYVLVADGMGGAAGGAEASRMAVELTDWILRKDLPQALATGTVSPLLDRVFREVNRWIYQKAQATPELRGMGTTMVLVVVSDSHHHVAHAGDSRAYRIRGEEIVQITRDHSLVQARVDAGLITAEEAMRQPDRNVITRAVGVNPEVEPDVSEDLVHPGDVFVLTSDGVHGVVPAASILTLAADRSPHEAAEALVQKALELKTTDNATAAVLRVGDGEAAPKKEELPPDPPAHSPSVFTRLRERLFPRS